MTAAREEVLSFRRRSRTFLKHARMSLKAGEFDFAAFAAEQAAQLGLKARLLESLGEVPRSHGVRELLGVVADSSPEASKEIAEFSKRNREGLKILDDAYISARYLPSVYSREDSTGLVKLSGDIAKLIRKTQREG